MTLTIKLIIVCLVIVNIVLGCGLVWIIKNFLEYREISKHNDGIFVDALKQHSTEIADIRTTAESDTNDLYAHVKDLEGKCDKTESKITLINNQLSAAFSALSAISK